MKKKGYQVGPDDLTETKNKPKTQVVFAPVREEYDCGPQYTDNCPAAHDGLHPSELGKIQQIPPPKKEKKTVYMIREERERKVSSTDIGNLPFLYILYRRISNRPSLLSSSRQRTPNWINTPRSPRDNSPATVAPTGKFPNLLFDDWCYGDLG